MRAAARVAPHLRGEVKPQMPLASRTSIRVGGAAELFFRPADLEALQEALRLCRDEGVPLHFLGGGANTVVGDGGVPGLTIKLPVGEDALSDRGDRVLLELSAGAPSGRLAALAKAHGLLGVEWSAGIPGTVGGLTAMNAGTRVGEMKDHLKEALLVGPEGAGWVPVSELGLGYRRSELKGACVARVRVELPKGTPEEAAASLDAMERDRAYRKNTQPLNKPNSGSVFRNPEGDHAGRLIESCGLKGTRRGAAQISEQHANFIVNHGGATAAEVTGLMALAQQTVLSERGLRLAPEVRLVGLFQPSVESLGLVIAS